jgi:polyhydroxybutyrate depolymerase
MPSPQSSRLLSAAALAASLLASACGGTATPPRTVFGGTRKVTLQVPPGYDAGKQYPLLVVLHGYGAYGALEASYLGAVASTGNAGLVSSGVFVIAPDGTLDHGPTDGTPSLFWNATDACCNFENQAVDDVAYLKGLIADIRADYSIDPKRVYLWGHSNGAFMAQRMACEDSGEVAAIISVAGATWLDASKCAPSAKVSVLDIHGDADQTIAYNGGSTVTAYPSEAVTMARWQAYDGCAAGLVTDPTKLDLEKYLPGAETVVSRFAGCPAGIGVELWTIQGGSHIPAWTPSFTQTAWAWLAAHPKP